MIKKWTALVLALCLLCTALPVGAEDVAAEEEEAQLTEAEQQELNDLDTVDEDDDNVVVAAGPVYREMELEDYTLDSPAVYTAKIIRTSCLRAERSKDSKILIDNVKDKNCEVLYVGTAWAIARINGVIGFIKRDHLYNAQPIDPVHTPPYGAQKHQYIATTADVCEVRKSMSDTDECWVVLNPGTLLSVWRIQDGWAIVNYWRSYGYIDMNDLTDLVPVCPTDTAIAADMPIAAYTSYYGMQQTELNKGRLINIDVACNRLTRVMEPGEEFNFNKQVGPYRKSIGYQTAIVLVDGKSVAGSGGGTCQVSSTLYNALLQLPGITILQRRPHGPGGAKYLPHGVDAAVGNDNLNLRFRNDYGFPIRIEGHTSYDGALLMVVYRADL